jgi:multicomponent Na+:H+ antiporter subunit E
MRPFVWNIFLAMAWAFAAGEVELSNLLVGFALGYVALGVVGPVVGESSYYRKVGEVLRFAVFYVWELIRSNIRVAHDVLTPTLYARPGVIAVPLDVKSDTEITLLANLITLTPGSLTLAVSADRRTLYVHAMFVDDPDKLRERIKTGYERRVIGLLR